MNELRYLASEQLGLVTTAQAKTCDVSRVKVHRMVQDGELRLIRRGVYSFESAPVSDNEELRAAWLSLDPSKTVAERLEDSDCAIICTTSAAQVYGVGIFQTYQHEFFTPVRKQSNAKDIRLRKRMLFESDIKVVSGLKVTSPTRTVLDLLDDVYELEHIAELIADIAEKNLYLDWDRIESELSKLSNKYQMASTKVLAVLRSQLEKEQKFQETNLLAANMAPIISNQMKNIWEPQFAAISDQYIAALKPVLETQQRIIEMVNTVSPKFPDIGLGGDLSKIMGSNFALSEETTKAITNLKKLATPHTAFMWDTAPQNLGGIALQLKGSEEEIWIQEDTDKD